MRSCYVTSILHDNEGNYFVEIHTQLEKALGFESGSEVYFSWLEKEIKVENRREWRHELIVTSISPDAWNDLYDLEFHLGDAPGSLTSVAEILSRKEINVLIAQSRTTMRGMRAEWTMSADFRRFDGDPEEFKAFLRKEIEENPDENRRKELEKRILKVTDKNETEDYVQIKRSKFYEELKELRKWGKDIPFGERLTSIQPRKVGDREVDTLGIPQYIMQRISSKFDTEPQNIDVAVIIADTEGSMLSLWFPRPTEKIAKIFFEIDYKPGSLFEIAKFLSDRGVNLLETDLNILVAGDKGVWKIAADINGTPGFPSEYSNCRSIGELESRLEVDMRKAGIGAIRKILNSEEVGIWAKKPAQDTPKEREIAIERGQLEKAEEFLRQYFISFDGNVRAILPYMDKTTFGYLDLVPKGCGIRIITSVIKDRNKCLEEADKLAQYRPFVEILELTMRTEEDYYTPLEHTRWICDEKNFIVLDTDLKKSALDSKDYSMEAKETSKCGRRIKKFEKRWNQKKSELEEESKAIVIRKFFYSSGDHS